MSINETEQAAAANAKAPRVRLEDIRDATASVYYVTGEGAVGAASIEPMKAEDFDALRLITICIVVMKNGFVVIGKSAPASPENFNAELGRRFSYEDAVRQLWPLMGFALKDRLSTSADNS